MAIESVEKHKCPPHHWIISEGVGHCKHCPATKDFGKLLQKQTKDTEGIVKNPYGVRRKRRKR